MVTLVKNSVEGLKEYFENKKMKSTKGSFIRTTLWEILFNNNDPVLNKRIENVIPLLTISDSNFIGFENATTRYVVSYLDSERMYRIIPLNEILSNDFSSHYILSLNEMIIYDNSPHYHRFTKKDYNFDSFQYSLKEYLDQFDDRITGIFQELLISAVMYLLDQAFTIFNIEYSIKEYVIRLKYKDVVIEISYNYKNELECIRHILNKNDIGFIELVSKGE